MGRRKSIWNRDVDRTLNKLEPSGCLSSILFGLIMIIFGAVFFGIDIGTIAVPIILLALGVIFIIIGIVLGVRYYGKSNKSNNDSDYNEF